VADRLDGAFWLSGTGSAGLAQGCRCALPLQAWVGAYRGGRPRTACYAPAPNRPDAMLLSDVCLCHVGPTSGLSREQRGPYQNWHRDSPRHTWLGHHFQGRHQAALLTAVLARQVAAAVGVKTCWPLETAKRFGAHGRIRKRGAGTYRGGRPPAACWNLPSSSLVNFSKIWLCSVTQLQAKRAPRPSLPAPPRHPALTARPAAATARPV